MQVVLNEGKLTKTKKKGSMHTQDLLEIFDTSVCGPYPYHTLNDLKYFISFIDGIHIMLISLLFLVSLLLLMNLRFTKLNSQSASKES